MSNSRPAQTSGSPQTSGPAQDSDVPAQPVFRGYSITGLARPGQFDNESAFPGINLNQNVELGLKNTFDNMIDHFEKAESEAAEALARQLLSWSGLPVLYRVYSHVVSIFFLLQLLSYRPLMHILPYLSTSARSVICHTYPFLGTFRTRANSS